MSIAKNLGVDDIDGPLMTAARNAWQSWVRDVHWFNTERPHESIDDLTPVQSEEFHYAHRTRLAEAG